MTDLLQAAALATTVLGLLSAAVVLAATRQLQQALATLLEFLLAAGLLRLSTNATWSALLTAALIISVRKLVVGVGLRPRATAPRGG